MKLSTRLLLPLLATVALVMALYGAWALYQRQTTESAQARSETQAYASALGLALERAFRDGAGRDVQEIIDRISREPKIYGVLVYGAEGGPRFVSEPLRPEDALPLGMLERVLGSGVATSVERQIADQTVYSVLRPIRGPDGVVLGAFEVAQPLAFVEEQKRQTTYRYLLNTLTLLAAVTAVILFLVRRLIGRPLEQLLTAARALGGGELSYRVHEDPAGGELADLAREFNRMAGRLQTAQAELVRETEERVTLERRMRDTEKLAAVGNLAAGLAHEIGAPLNVIAGRAEMVLKREMTQPVRERNLRIIVDQIARITATVHGLLDFARRREPRIQPTDLALVVDGVAEFLEGELARASIELVRRTSGPAWVQGDPHLLHQVFVNLLMNAVHALEHVEGTRRITIRIAAVPGPDRRRATRAGARTDPGMVTGTDRAARRRAGPVQAVRVEVEDTGPGIPEDVLPRIFEPFFTTKTAGEGTGLGLAVALSIVDEHGGRLVAESRPPGRPGCGALFRLTLPAAAVPEPVHA